MKHTNTYKKYTKLFCLILVCGLLSCKKFLDEKPKLSQVVPHTLSDLQALLDNYTVMNQRSPSGYAELGADNYYLPDSYYQMFNGVDGANWYTQNYIWDANAHPIDLFWTYPYTGPVYNANIVLDQLPNMVTESKDTSIVKALKGSALFFRAFTFYHLAQLYCRPYAQQYLSSPGIVLRLTSDAGVVDRRRSTVAETYDKIIEDLKLAATLLPTTTVTPARPCKAAVYAALARVFLSMNDYENAGSYADLALQQRNELIDYNSKIPATDPPFTSFSEEVIFDDISVPVLITDPSFALIDTLLYQSYDADDLRKDLLFKQANGGYVWCGTYSTGSIGYSGQQFDGFATDELYLIRAECSARAGNKDLALADLNKLIKTRWRNSVTYPDITANDANEALAKILTERRKELVYRGTRWTDIRRFNTDGGNIILERNIGGTIFTISPNDPRYVMLIPSDEIIRSGIEQNPR